MKTKILTILSFILFLGIMASCSEEEITPATGENPDGGIIMHDDMEW